MGKIFISEAELELILFTLLVVFGSTIALYFGVRNARGIFLLYFILGAVLPYFVFVETGSLGTFLAFFLNDDDTYFAGLLLALAFVCSLVSSIIVMKPISYEVTPFKFRASRLQALALMSILFFLIYVALSVAFAGSIQNAILASYSRVRTNSTLANIRTIFFWGNVVFTTFAFYGMRHAKTEFKVRFWIYISILSSSLLSVVDGGRAILILFVLSLFMRQILNATPRKMLLYATVVPAIIVVVSYVMLSLRYSAQEASITSEGSLSVTDAFTGLTFVDHFQLSIQYATDVGFDYGKTYFNAALSFLPRDIFPGKAVPMAAQMRGYVYGDETGGVPPGLFGEAYMFLGVFGVILISILYGRILLATAILCKRAVFADCPVRYATAGIIVPLIGFTLVRGGLDIGVLRVGFPFFWIFIAIMLASRNSAGQLPIHLKKIGKI